MSLVNMKISWITREEARNIAELLGGGSVVWSNGRCYPAREIECEIATATCRAHDWHSTRLGDKWQTKCRKCGCLNDDTAPMLE